MIIFEGFSCLIFNILFVLTYKPMKTSDHLFQLIKSLSKNEKGYFKKHISKGTMGQDNNYMKLFEAMDRQKEYDEREIKMIFAGETFIKQLSTIKNYLYHLILKALNVYHSEISVETKLMEWLKQAEILFKRGLYEQCEKILSKAKKTAYRYERYIQLLDIIRWEYRLLITVGYAGVSGNDPVALQNEEQRLLEKIDCIAGYKWLALRMFMLLRKRGTARNPDEIEEFAVFKNHPLFSAEESGLPYYARISYYFVKGFYYDAIDDRTNCYKYLLAQVDFLESHLDFITEDPPSYAAALNNLVITCILLKKYDVALACLQKQRAIAEMPGVRISKQLQARLFANSYLNELNICKFTGNFKDGFSLIKEIEAGLTLFGNTIHKEGEMVLYDNVSQICFGYGDYNEALMWMNKILNDNEVHIREDILCSARIFNLIIHYELGNEDLLEYLVKSTYRFLYKRKRLYKFETDILNFIRKKLPEIDTQKQLIGAFKGLKEELVEIIKDPFEKKALEYFDFISWLESKIENRPFAEIVREKAKKPENATI